MPRPEVARVALRRAVSLTLLALVATVGAIPGSAAAEGIELKTAVAMPLAPRPVDTFESLGPNISCTADPRSKLYATDSYDPTINAGWIENNPASDDLIPDFQAGASRDLCAAFTLTPNIEESVISEDSPWRILDPARPVPDVLDTHTYDPLTEHVLEGDDMRDITVDLPAGYAGAPAAIPTCSESAFGLAHRLAVTCAANTQVGDALVRLTLPFGALVMHAALPIGRLYHLPAGPNELARIGAVVVPPDEMISGVAPTKFIIRLTLTPDGSGRIRATVDDAPRHLYGTDQLDAEGNLLPGNALSFLPTYIEGVGIRVWGSKAEHPTMAADFGQSGTNCSIPARGSFDVTTYLGTRSTQDSTPFTLTGCDALEFHPTVKVETTERRPGVPTGVGVKLGFGQQSTNGLGTALLKDAAITLPAGLELGAQVASGDGGLPLCTAAQFDRASGLKASTCPAASAAATVKITTPLIDRPFVGKAYLGEQSAVGELPALYVEAALDGATAADAPRIKLVGSVAVDADGRVTATFRDNPQLRFSELALEFPAGPNALFVTPRACGTATASSALTPWSGKAPTSVDASITIDQDCDTPPLKPTLAMTPSSAAAGASAPTAVAITRADRSPWLQGVSVALPTGFLADLGSVSECSAAALAAASCPGASRMGTVRVTAGAGEKPLPLTGGIYLTAREQGDVAGAAIIVRAKIGGIDLGDVVVPARIELRPTDAGLTLRTTAPLRHRGLALGLRSIVVDLDRPGFALNPSACGPLDLSGSFTGPAGESASAAATVAYTGCGDLPLQPRLVARLYGDVKPGSHPGMHVEMYARPGDGNLKAAVVTLPAGVATDTANLKNTCAPADFAASACPAAAKVGQAKVQVAIAPEAITGDVYLLKVAGSVLPGLGLSFTGRYAQRVSSTVQIDKNQRVVVRFDAIPDLPLRSLIIDVDGGPKGPLQLPVKACANGTDWDGVFTSHGGKQATASFGLRCAAPATVRLDRGTGLSVRAFDFGGRNLQSLKVSLPEGVRFAPRRSRAWRTSWVRLAGSDGKLTVRKTSVLVTARDKTARTVRLKIGAGAVRVTSRKLRKATISLRFAFTDGAVQTQEITVPVR